MYTDPLPLSVVKRRRVCHLVIIQQNEILKREPEFCILCEHLLLVILSPSCSPPRHSLVASAIVRVTVWWSNERHQNQCCASPRRVDYDYA